MIRRYWYWGVLVFGLSFVLACLGFGLPFELMLYTGFGWVPFVARVAPRASVAWDGVFLALLCGAGVIALVQALGNWIVAEVASGRVWRVRWTLGGFAAVVLMFSLGIAATGVVHQAGWLLTTRERLLGYHGTVLARYLSVSNLKQIGLALHNYERTYESLPPGATIDADGRAGQGWMAQAIPFIEVGDLARDIRLDRPWDDPSNAAVIRRPASYFQIPKTDRDRTQAGDLPMSHYAGNAWVLGGTRAWRLAEITDGTANTILVGEAAGRFRPWAEPHAWRDPRLGINRHHEGFGSPFPGGANFLFADGSVHFIKNLTRQATFEALCTPTGGEQIAADEY